MTPLLAVLLNKAHTAGHLKMSASPEGVGLHVDYFGMKFTVATATYAELGMTPPEMPVPEANIEPAPTPAPPAGRPNLRLVQ